ncbi:hypothetical protein NKI32_26310 [Mesorhizobium sp. M0761]|uniref:hypothetical protein n=1 Tax=Mesorhizobium sp. M0761 TaxID=2956994 RepID=UPI00333D3C66
MYFLSARLDATLPSRETQPIEVSEVGAIVRLNHDAPALGRLDGRRERGFNCGDGIFSAHDHGDVSLMRSSESHACAVPEKENVVNQWVVGFALLSEIRH